MWPAPCASRQKTSLRAGFCKCLYLVGFTRTIPDSSAQRKAATTTSRFKLLDRLRGSVLAGSVGTSASEDKLLSSRESHPGVIPDYPGLSRIKTFDRAQRIMFRTGGIVQQLRPTTPAGRESNAARDLHQRVCRESPVKGDKMP